MKTPPAPFISHLAVLFQKGTLVRNLTDECLDITPGRIYKVTQTSKGIVHFGDDVNYPRYRPGYRYEVVRASSRDYVADLSEEEAHRAVANGTSTKHPLSSLSRKLPDTLSEVLMAAFTRSLSPEGATYWDAICRREIKKEEHTQ